MPIRSIFLIALVGSVGIQACYDADDAKDSGPDSGSDIESDDTGTEPKDTAEETSDDSAGDEHELSAKQMILVVEEDPEAALEAAVLAFENGQLVAPVFYLERDDTTLLERFAATQTKRKLVYAGSQEFSALLETRCTAADTVVLAPVDGPAALYGALVASTIGAPLLVGKDLTASDLSTKQCLAFGSVTAPCQELSPVAEKDLLDLLIDAYQASGEIPTYMLLVGDDEPMLASAAYLGAARRALPFFASREQTPAEIRDHLFAELKARAIVPRELLIFGHHDYVPSTFRDQGGDQFYDDFDYVELDHDGAQDIIYGRLVTLDMQDAFNAMSHILYYRNGVGTARDRVALAYCTRDPVDGDYCLEETAAKMCMLREYFTDKGLTVDEVADENLTHEGLAGVLATDGLVFKFSHGNTFGTSLFADFSQMFEANDLPYLPAGLYETNSCNTANYLFGGEQSYLLNYFRQGGVGYIGKASYGGPLPNFIPFLSQGSAHAAIAFGPGLLWPGKGYDYHGDPAFNPGYPADPPSALSAELKMTAQHTAEIAVALPPTDLDYYCNAGLLAHGFDYYVDMFDGYVYSVLVRRFELPAGENSIAASKLKTFAFEGGQWPIVEDCPKVPKEEQDTYVCNQYDGQRALYVNVRGSGYRVPIYFCRVDQDPFSDKTFIECHLGFPFAPLDAEKIDIARLTSYTIELTTRYAELPCEILGGACAETAEACSIGSAESLNGTLGCMTPLPVCCVPYEL